VKERGRRTNSGSSQERGRRTGKLLIDSPGPKEGTNKNEHREEKRGRSIEQKDIIKEHHRRERGSLFRLGKNRLLTSVVAAFACTASRKGAMERHCVNSELDCAH